MTARSFESEWLDYAVDNTRANEAYRAQMARLHRAYTVRVQREVRTATSPARAL